MAPERRSPAVAISCHFSAASDYRVGDPIDVEFAITNAGTNDVFVLTWYSPLEGIKGNIFDVLRDDTELRYRGVLMKRGDPTVDDYIALGIGETAAATVDIRDAYDVRETGTYTVRLSSPLSDVTDVRNHVPRSRADHEPYVLDCEALRFDVHR